MSVIKLGVEPGVVSAIYFIIFDLFMLAIVDVVLIHVVSYLYYKRIYKGIPLELNSAEIPGVATSLVGRFFSPPNLFAYFTKIALLACVLIVDSNIETEFNQPRSRTSLSGRFIYEPSNQSWNTSINRIVERRFEAIRQCHTFNDDKTNITFYSIAFNLANDRQLDSEVAGQYEPIVPLNDSTIQCLAKKKVAEKDERILAEVIGCSDLDEMDCFDETPITRNLSSLPMPEYEDNIKIPVGTTDVSNVSYLLSFYPGFGYYISPKYNGANMTCSRTAFGTSVRTMKIFESCLVTMVQDNNTLIERWELNRKSGVLTRRFPGPILKGFVDIGRYQSSVILQNVVSNLNWVSFSGQLLADGVIYEPAFADIVKLGKETPVTTVPVFTTVLTILLIIAAGVSRVVVFLTIGKIDERPKLNTINGLSSVGREENEPTGRSTKAGRGMVIGLTKREGRSIHFGPLTSRDIGIPRERGAFIE